MNTLEYSKEELLSFIKKNKSYRYVVVMFTAEWCRYCRKMLSIFEQLLLERKEKDILFLPIDTEKNSLLSKDSFFSVSVIPKIFIFQWGNFWRQIEGSIDLQDLRNFFTHKKS